jgi:excisionase family DNA binding protein
MALSLSVEAAAALLGLSERTVWRKIRAGELPVIREGRRVLVQVERPPRGRRVAEVAAPYATEDAAVDPLVGPWPYTAENVKRQRERLRERRIAALDAILQIAKETRPDPNGLTVVDHLRDIRDPDWEPEEDD